MWWLNQYILFKTFSFKECRHFKFINGVSTFFFLANNYLFAGRYSSTYFLQSICETIPTNWYLQVNLIQRNLYSQNKGLFISYEWNVECSIPNLNCHLTSLKFLIHKLHQLDRVGIPKDDEGWCKGGGSHKA